MISHYKQESLDDIVKGMKSLGEVLMPYNFPKVQYTQEDEVGLFKMRNIVVDGYVIMLHYQKSDYSPNFIESLQIHSVKSPFLPFSVICKIGKKFFGCKHLSLIEIIKDHRKIYVWSLCTDENNNPIELPNKNDLEECEFEGLQYCYLYPNMVDFHG